MMLRELIVSTDFAPAVYRAIAVGIVLAAVTNYIYIMFIRSGGGGGDVDGGSGGLSAVFYACIYIYIYYNI